MSRRRYVYSKDAKGNVVSREVGQDWKPTLLTDAVDRYVEDSRLFGKVTIPGADAPKNRKGEETAIDELTGKPLREIDISSRTRHRRYMKERDLHNADDHVSEWAKREEERQRIRETGRSGRPDPERRRALEQAFHDVQNGKRFKESNGFSESERQQLFELARETSRR